MKTLALQSFQAVCMHPLTFTHHPGIGSCPYFRVVRKKERERAI